LAALALVQALAMYADPGFDESIVATIQKRKEKKL